MTGMLFQWKQRARAKAKRKPKLRLAASLTPNGCVVLAVDTAKNSGWALFVRGKYYSSGEATIMNHGKLVALIRYGSGVVMDSGLSSHRYVLVLERSWGGGPHQIEGLGAARHAWLSAWCDAHATKTPRRVVRVFPNTWRARLGIPLHGGRAYREPIEIRRALDARRGHPDKGTVVPGADEAAAILIGIWASCAGEVAAALRPKPKKARAARC